jgi:hypothetical protein
VEVELLTRVSLPRKLCLLALESLLLGDTLHGNKETASA